MSDKILTLECGGEIWVRIADVHPMQDKIIALESRLHQLSEDHSHCEGLLHELGERASRAEGRLDKVLALVADLSVSDCPTCHEVRALFGAVVERQQINDPDKWR